MTTALFDITKVLPLLNQGATLLTPNNRLRNHMRLAYCKQLPEAVVQSPKIYSLNEWVNQQWIAFRALGSLEVQRVVLDETQELTLWTDILQHSDLADPTANFQRFATQLREAHRFLTLWDIPIEELESAHWKQQADALPIWLKQFQSKLDTLGAMTAEQRIKPITQAFAQGVLSPVKKIVLESFEELPPITEQCLKAATPALITDNADGKSKQPHTTIRTSCTDFNGELTSAARWSHAILQQHPDAQIGIIVPTLGNDRHLVERIFSEVFEPQLLNPETPRYTLPFNISTGTPLATTPLISDTLLLLKLHQPQLSIQDWQQLSHSPFFGSISHERGLRAELLARIVKLAQFEVGSSFVREAAQKISAQFALESFQTFSTGLQQFEENRRRQPSSASANHWLGYIRDQLSVLHWPGERNLDSVEYQQVQQWYRLLEQTAGLDFLGKPLTFSEFLQQLTRAAMRTHFQAELKSSPIQLLGTLEAAGLTFTHCWVVGLNNRSWPTQPHPNPLIPIGLQRKYQLPRVSTAKETLYAKSLTENFLHCADHVVVSYCSQQDDTKTLPSALITQIPEVPIETVLNNAAETSLAAFLQNLENNRSLEWVDCQQGPALVTNDNETTKGGSDILKQQALCPFNAFASHRLGAKQIDEPQLGLTAIDKGNLVHKVLEIFWENVNDQKTLLAQEPSTIRQHVANALNHLFTLQYKRNIKILGDLYYELERERLVTLISDWLDTEKQRPDFTVIEKEKSLVADIAGLRINLRIDRVDATEHGELILIDYKTGSPTIGGLTGERPEEPQLLLYCLYYQGDTAAIALAQINNKAFKWVGIGDLTDQKRYPGIETADSKKVALENWPSAVENFRQVITKLATDFSQGYCAVDFKSPDAERYADYLKPLNRIDEKDYLLYIGSAH